MPTKACLRGQVFTAPEGSTVEFAPGTLINLWHDAYNCGNEAGYIYAWIKEDATIIAHDRQHCDPQTSAYSCALAKKDNWVMPNKTVKIHMIGKHAGPPDWVVVQDYDKVWTLKPSIITCGQPVKVVNKYGNPIPYAVVYAYQNGTIKDSITVGSDGRGSLTLNTGESYRLKAFKTNYECYICEKTITACTSEVTLSLTKVPELCTQNFKVVDYDTGVGIGGAYVNVAGVTLVTYADGTCSKPELTVGNSYTAVASKSGYTCDGVCSKTFTACTSTIILKLKKEITYCHQPFKVIDKTTGAVIPGVTIKLNEPPLTSCVTNSYGKCSITKLQVGWGLSVTVTKSGYVTGSDSFTACTGERTIKLEKEVGVCTQEFMVVDQSSMSLEGATVTVGAKTCTTDYRGECSINELIEGNAYTALASKAGYECYSAGGGIECQKDFVCPEFTVVLWLKEIAIYCGQPVKVVDENDAPIKGANVVAYQNGLSKSVCLTNTDGVCTLEMLKEGEAYDIEATKEGYKTDSDSFTACTAERTIQLEKEILYCDQRFRVVDKAMLPLSGATIKLNEPPLSSCVTDSDGECSITDLKIGWSLSVNVTKPGYVPMLNRHFTACVIHRITYQIGKELIKKDTKIVDFSVHDENEKDVTALQVGKEYRLRAYLKTIDDLSIQNATLYFRKEDGSVIWNYLTDADGYVGISWTPQSTDVGTYIIKAEFDGSEALNPSASDPISITVKEVTIDNYDIVLVIGKSVWGFDWIANNFVSKILPKITDTLNRLGITGLVVHGDRSYYDATKKHLIVNVDLPSHSPVAPLILLAIPLIILALILLGVFIKEYFFDHKGVEPVAVMLRTVDTDGNVITEPVALTVNDVTKTTSAGVVGFAVNERFQVLCPDEAWDIFDSTKWYDATTVIQDVVLSSTATREVKLLVTDEEGNPLPNEDVHVLDADGKYIRTAKTDEDGYVTLTMGAGEYTVVVINEEGIPTGTVDIPSGTEDVEEDIETPSGYALRVYAREEDTALFIDGAAIIMNGITGTTEDRSGALIAGLEDKEYTITAQHPSYNDNIPVEYPEKVNPRVVVKDIIIDMEHTGNDATVRIYPRYKTQNVIGAKVKLGDLAEKTTTQMGYVEYSSVPYGTYKVAVIAPDFEQKEPEKMYPVDESHQVEGVVTIIVSMDTTIIPPSITIECNVKDENGEPVPEALIDIDSKRILWSEYDDITAGDIEVGSLSLTAFKNDSGNIKTDENGYCKFNLLPIGTDGINSYRFRAGKSGYYNEKGKEDWTEFTAPITASASILFTLSTKPPVKIPTMLIVYGGATIGCYIIGSVLPEKPGKAVKIITIIPAALAGYEGYKSIKEKIPAWLK